MKDDGYYLFQLLWYVPLIFLFYPLSSEGFLDDLAGKESASNVGDLGSFPELGRFPGGGNCYPLQYSGLENSMDCIVHGVTKSWTWLSGFHIYSEHKAFLLLWARSWAWVPELSSRLVSLLGLIRPLTVSFLWFFLYSLNFTDTADGDCSHKIKGRLLLGRKVMMNLDSILKSRDITLPTKVCLVKAMVFPVVMYGCESWTIKKAENQRIDAFELRCWRRLLRVPWTARGSNQSILKEISPGCSLEGLMLKLKLQYFGHLMQRADSFEKTVMLGKIEGMRRSGW